SEGGLGVRDLRKVNLAQVGSFGKWDGGVWIWEVSVEKDLLHGLLVLLDSASLSLSSDSSSWKFKSSGLYSVKSAYLSLIAEAQTVTARLVALIRILASLWKSWAPLKVIVFSEQLLQDRIPSRQNLLR
ncbi:hypothetical protein A2U01_0027034, partial [Trifolium medium]|nr:hypothetical protein [Trifolium medium]